MRSIASAFFLLFTSFTYASDVSYHIDKVYEVDFETTYEDFSTFLRVDDNHLYPGRIR